MSKQQSAGSLVRANILISAIARGSRQGSALTELVARTGLPRPTIHRVLDQLIAMGWVERHPQTAHFNLGAELAALGYNAIARHGLERIAAPVLSGLAVTLQRVVYLNVRSGLDMVCIGRYESGIYDENERGAVGLRGPLGMSPGCTAIFAKLPQDEVEGVIQANLSRYHRIQGFDELAFRKTVAEAQRKGFGTYDHILLDRTLCALAVAITDEAQYPVAAVGITYYRDQVGERNAERMLDNLQHAAHIIGQRLSSSQI